LVKIIFYKKDYQFFMKIPDCIVYIIRYFQTLKYLKPSQILWRVFYRIKPHRPPALLSYKVRNLSLEKDHYWVANPNKVLRAFEFKYLNIRYLLKNSDDWNDPKLSKLWLYNLHYFDDLLARDWCKDNSNFVFDVVDKSHDRRVDWHKVYIEKWVNENPPLKGVGWEPYPTSLRIVNWIKWSLQGGKLNDKAQNSLYIQCSWLYENPEWHLLGNHLIANAKALIFAGIFFENAAARRWLAKGISIFSNQISEQVLNDGGHFELSPMYHSVILMDVLDVINIGKASKDSIARNLIDDLIVIANKMFRWLELMTHTDGDIAFFNDSTLGVAPKLVDIKNYLIRLNLYKDQKILDSSNRVLASPLVDSGYINIMSPKSVLIFDAAEIGAKYLPGHGHADLLSFELSILGFRIIVNGGTSLYDDSPLRLNERSTISHSTIQYGETNSSDIWGAFRVGCRAIPSGLKIHQINEECIEVYCQHSGPENFKKFPTLGRKIKHKFNSVDVVDSCTLDDGLVFSKYIFHPSLKICRIENSNNWRIKLPSGELISFLVLNGYSKKVNAKYSFGFGETVETNAIDVKLINNTSRVSIRWS